MPILIDTLLVYLGRLLGWRRAVTNLKTGIKSLLEK
jgi:hypothetical protein